MIGVGFLQGRVLGLAGMIAIGACRAGAAKDDAPATPTAVALDVATSPAAGPGLSTLEGRYVYARPDEGELTIPLSLNFSLPGEFSIQEPQMLAGGAMVQISYSKARNIVEVHLQAQGLPFRPTFTKDVDDSTPFNRQLMKVEHARWRLWLAGTFFGRQHEDLYYRDVQAREFLGSRYDVEPLGPRSALRPRTYDTLQGNARQMVGLPLLDPDRDGNVDLRFRLPYDRVADAAGTPGTVNIVLPLDACAPDALVNYWTETVLPPDKFMTWDTFLSSIWNGEGISVALTAEPAAGPADLAMRPSTFTGWANVYPAILPPGFGLDLCTFGTIVPIMGRSYQLDLWPATSRRNACRT